MVIQQKGFVMIMNNEICYIECTITRIRVLAENVKNRALHCKNKMVILTLLRLSQLQQNDIISLYHTA